jgi:hypothetical protein
LHLPDVGSGFLELGFGLIEAQLGVARIEFADDVALAARMRPTSTGVERTRPGATGAIWELSSAMKVPVSSKSAGTWRTMAVAVVTETGAAVVFISAGCLELQAPRNKNNGHRCTRVNADFIFEGLS